MSKLEGKNIVVTGSQGLLGKAIGEAIVKNGGNLIEADINLSDGQSLDISDSKSITTFIASVVDKYGKIHGWVNCAYPRTSDWGNKLSIVNRESLVKNLDMHLAGYMECGKLIGAVMAEQGEGSIVDISSIYGFKAPDFSLYEGTDMTMPAAYSAIKAGIINYSKYLSSYFGPKGVRANVVSPGGIFDNQNVEFVSRYEQKTPLRRLGSPQDIAPSVVFLLSDEAAYITGHNLVIDGGWSN